jgi:hypothetical protein
MTGIDFSKKMLAIARQHPEIPFSEYVVQPPLNSIFASQPNSHCV